MPLLSDFQDISSIGIPILGILVNEITCAALYFSSHVDPSNCELSHPWHRCIRLHVASFPSRFLALVRLISVLTR